MLGLTGLVNVLLQAAKGSLLSAAMATLVWIAFYLSYAASVALGEIISALIAAV